MLLLGLFSITVSLLARAERAELNMRYIAVHIDIFQSALTLLILFSRRTRAAVIPEEVQRTALGSVQDTLQLESTSQNVLIANDPKSYNNYH